jgi:hypothetical protein
MWEQMPDLKFAKLIDGTVYMPSPWSYEDGNRDLQVHGYRLLRPDSDGILRSRIFPGLWLDEAAWWRGDLKAVRATLEAGLQSADHQEFLSRFK